MVRMVPISDSDGRSGFAQRLRQAALNHGYPEHGMGAEIARVMGVSPKAVNKWLNALAMPEMKRIDQLAAHFRVSADWLLTGRGQIVSPLIQGVSVRHISADVPIVDFATLADALISEAPYPATMAADWIPCTMVHGQRTLAYRMPDSSMTTLDEHTIPEGFTVCVDPDQRAPKDGEAILAKLATGRYLTARFRSQAGSEWVELPNHPPHLQPREQFEVVGRVIFSGRER